MSHMLSCQLQPSRMSSSNFPAQTGVKKRSSGQRFLCSAHSLLSDCYDDHMLGLKKKHDSLAEWSKALASGASPQGRGLEPHSCQPLVCKRCGGVPAHFGKASAPLPDIPIHAPHLPPPALTRRRCRSQPRARRADLAAARASGADCCQPRLLKHKLAEERQ